MSTHKNPLQPPDENSQTLGLFLSHFGIRPDPESREVMGDVSRAFSRIPYENLTKILKYAEGQSAERSRRLPGEVVADHIRLGAGGTCFSLTAALLHILRALGWESEPLLADRHYGTDTHCALLVRIDGQPHLLDPGYLIVDPIPLDGKTEQRIQTPFHHVILRPRGGGEMIELHTEQGGGQSHRLTFKSQPVDAGQFLRAWDASFDWEMMHYPVLTRVRDGQHVYLQDHRIQLRSHDSVERAEVSPDELTGRIAAEFGVNEAVTLKALELLRREQKPNG